jgi:uncharacterized membrane protein
MISEKFRHQLRHEAELWRAEGLIDDSQYEQLLERYQFNILDTSARNRFVTILIGLGSILIGLGVITFVAANWQELPRIGKVIILMSLFIGVNIVGFSKWKQPNHAQQRLGQGLLLLGALILGANMGLMGQMFHINAPFYELLLAWGIGVLAMTYSLRLTSMGVLSIILIGLGYWDFWWKFVESSWSISSSIEESSLLSLMGQHLPVVAGLLFIPLAYWCRSRWIFVLAQIAIVSSLAANITLLNQSAPWALVIAVALPPALLWGYDDSWLIYSDFPWLSNGRYSQGGAMGGSFQPISRQLALVWLGVSFYSLSFYWFWGSDSHSATTPSRLNWFLLLDALILSCLAIIEWWRLALARQRRDREDNLTTVVIGVFICISALVPLWHTSVAPIPLVATFIFNALLFLLAAGLIREGLAQGRRRAFWGGMVLLILRILNWFVLSNTELLFKSLVFILCGFGVIAIGLWFERYVSTLGNTSKRRAGGTGGLRG